ncbi:N-acetylmuramoyl-L-alanine amidase family protein [Intestinimonas massiliensis (ex Afouda et al. 2020)]|uniref:N-acetylmuramoyl-L-alanine amidase n=1 Tax=Intestinimonas massiliensis (ex Afouda et al. 2020) TaxID=1673721 RepID=A0ABS9ME73_9FIRM|nr:N-acetylmuramoyl-L-alanine amidase [Intestinimonas massiliensis (ex Afouda et al. 2020)]MCG4528771.1 N-acetylmuramoyl-L-alanine amidase [Intestinimonas massiliensis (ex Afouda et al. 2020)]
MSKYKLGVFPQDQYRFRIFDNTAKLKDWPEIMTAAGPDCVAAMNLAYFALSAVPAQGIRAFDHQSAIMVAGKWEHGPAYHEYGICINADGRLTLGTEADAVYDYAVALPPAVIGGRDYNTSTFARDGVTYLGLRSDDTVVILISIKDQGMTSAEAVAAMRQAGCVHILRWDGSWSSRGCLGPGQALTPSQYRMVRSWLLLYKRGNEPQKEDKPVTKTVCLDPGHGVESPGKCSPDKSYYEHEFALDMGKRIKTHLERCGIRVVLTRTDEHCPTGKADTNDLLKRVAISDAAGADLFVSLHSNASGNEWSNASGLMIYTSAGPDTASRNVAAKAVLARMTAAGVELRGSPLIHDIELVVTRKTAAPAMLIEYGFHTSKTEVELLKKDSYRAKLAEATAKGVCDFLGVVWVDEPTDTGVSDWAATAWQKATNKGVLDGTRPTDPVTRQELAVVLDRLNLI